MSEGKLSQRVTDLGKQLNVNINAYDARHQWTRDALDAGNTRTDILLAGGWSKESSMIERYVDQRVIANEHITLHRET